MIKSLIEQMYQLTDEEKTVYIISNYTVIKSIVRSAVVFYNENGPSLSCWTDSDVKICKPEDIYETEEEAYNALKTMIEQRKQEIDNKYTEVTTKVEQISATLTKAGDVELTES